MFIRTLWQINPAIAVHLTERLNLAVVRAEVTRLVRSSTADVLDVPEALNFLLGEGMESIAIRRDLKVRCHFIFAMRYLTRSSSFLYGLLCLRSWRTLSLNHDTRVILYYYNTHIEFWNSTLWTLHFLCATGSSSPSV